MLVYAYREDPTDGVYLLLDDASVVEGKVRLRMLCLPNGVVYAVDTKYNERMHDSIEIWRA